MNALRVPFVRRGKQDVEHATGFWAGAAHRVMARPAISLGLGVGLLLAAAVPLLGIKTGFSGVSTHPDDVQSKQAFTVLARDFSGGLTQPAQIVVDGPVRTGPVQQAIVGLQRTLASDRAFGPSTVQVNAAGNLALVAVPVSGDPNSEDAFTAIRQLRADTIPAVFSGVDAHVLVGGPTAGAVDFFDLTAQYTPIVFAFVLGLSFLLLMMVFRSVVIPLLGVVLNLLSTGAAYGLLILVFQHGVATGLFGFQQVETIEAWLPLRPHRRQPRRGVVRPAHHRRHHHRRGADHGGGVRGVRLGPAGVPAGDGVRPWGGGADRRHDRPLGPGPGRDGAAREAELVPAEVAGVAAPDPGRRAAARR